jgi:hypothetical protein
VLHLALGPHQPLGLAPGRLQFRPRPGGVELDPRSLPDPGLLERQGFLPDPDGVPQDLAFPGQEPVGEILPRQAGLEGQRRVPGRFPGGFRPEPVPPVGAPDLAPEVEFPRRVGAEAVAFVLRFLDREQQAVHGLLEAQRGGVPSRGRKPAGPGDPQRGMGLVPAGLGGAQVRIAGGQALHERVQARLAEHLPPGLRSRRKRRRRRTPGGVEEPGGDLRSRRVGHPALRQGPAPGAEEGRAEGGHGEERETRSAHEDPDEVGKFENPKIQAIPMISRRGSSGFRASRSRITRASPGLRPR